MNNRELLPEMVNCVFLEGVWFLHGVQATVHLGGEETPPVLGRVHCEERLE